MQGTVRSSHIVLFSVGGGLQECLCFQCWYLLAVVLIFSLHGLCVFGGRGGNGKGCCIADSYLIWFMYKLEACVQGDVCLVTWIIFLHSCYQVLIIWVPCYSAS